MKPDVIIAASLGRGGEPSSLVACRRVETLGEEFDRERKRWPVSVRYEAGRLQRFDRGARYQEIVDEIAPLVAKLEGARLSLVVDVSMAGRPPVELMLASRLRPAPVVITESDAARPGRGFLAVPRADLVSALGIVLGDRRLRVPDDHAEAPALARDMAAFRMRPPKTGAFEQPRDDTMVLAVALAVWWGETRLVNLTRQPLPPRVMPDPARPPTWDEMFKRHRNTLAQQRRVRI